jgi:uncharacterized protein
MASQNHLANQTSPYLLQHANNPVDWYHWCKTALDKAVQENKPILLSIGYAACHWCHVMAHESFEDQKTADLMNQLFINIKVDREERPDLDKVYQTAHHVLNQRGGGWPLTVFLTPNDLTPFFSGTYFPKERRYQLPAFKEILQKIAAIYHNQPEDIQKQNVSLQQILQKPPTKIDTKIKLTEQPIALALQAMQKQFDPLYGGFGSAPKFPYPAMLFFLLKEKSDMLTITLEKMALGGIYDQLSGGFYRYSVDEKWQIPHFEKMLYDNGLLLSLYTQAYTTFKDDFYADIAFTTATWVINEMQATEGGYYSSLDADSEGHEGQYYIWDEQEIKERLTKEEHSLIHLMFGLNKTANFEGKWHLTLNQRPAAKDKDLLSLAKTKLLKQRNLRIKPFRDEKILTAWNALMIKGMALAGQALNQPAFSQSANDALNFLKTNLVRDKRLVASYKDGKAHLAAYLDDYVYLLDALLCLLQIKWDTDLLLFAIELADILLTDFYDEQAGGFYFTAKQHENLLYRPKTFADEAIPAGNGIAAQSLLILGHLLGEPRYIDAAEATLQAAWPMLSAYPSEHSSLLLALEQMLKPTSTIVLRGKHTDLKIWSDYSKTQLNNVIIFAIPLEVQDLPGLLSNYKASEISAYICQGTQCLAAISNFNQFKEEILHIKSLKDS